MESRYAQAIQVLPPRFREWAARLSEEDQRAVEEIRLRIGFPMTVLLPEGERPLGADAVEQQDLERLVELASRASLHAVLDQVRQGFMIVEGGHRLGLCGTALLENGQVHRLTCFSSANLRVAREMPGVAHSVLPRVCENRRLGSTLIFAPPGLGKTTLLRDLIRVASEGEGCQPLRVGVVDDRGELAAPWRGVPQCSVGRRTDVLVGCPKAQGLMMLLRAMNPQVLAVDEITSPEDAEALRMASGCGVILLATAHGTSIEDLQKRPVYRSMLHDMLFQRLVMVRQKNGVREYCVEELTP